MANVTAGGVARGSRRQAAYDRLGVHLGSHKSHHEDKSDEEFKSHDTIQKKEYSHISDILNGTHN